MFLRVIILNSLACQKNNYDYDDEDDDDDDDDVKGQSDNVHKWKS